MIDQLRALIERWRDEAIKLNAAGCFDSAIATTVCAFELESFLPPPQPPDAYTNIPFVSVAEADQYAKEHTR